MKNKLLLCLLLSFSAAYSQTSPIVWQKMLNDYTAFADPSAKRDMRVEKLVQLQNGDILVIGNLDGEGAVITRRTSAGNKIWEMQVNSSQFMVSDALEANDGSMYIAGSHEHTTLTIRNTNAVTNDIIEDFTDYPTKSSRRSINGGSSLITSITTPQDWDKVSGNMMLMKISANGIIDWIRLFGGSYIDLGRSVIKADASNVWLVGHSRSPVDTVDIVGSHIGEGVASQYYDIYAVKVSDTGQKLVSKFYGSTDDEELYHNKGVVSSDDGGFALVLKRGNSGYRDGDFADFDTTETFHNSNVILKINSTGAIEWKTYFNTIDYTNYGSAMRITRTTDGNYLLLDNAAFLDRPFPTTEYHTLYDDYAGSYNQNTLDIRLTKISSAGNILWKKYYGGKYHEDIDLGASIAATSDGGAIFLTTAKSPDGDVEGSHATDPFYKNDVWVVKTDASGTIQWNKAFGGTGEELLPGGSVISTADGNYLFSAVPGSSDGDVLNNTDSEGNRNSWLVKFQLPCLVPLPTSVTANQRVCAGTAIQLSATCEAGSVVKWYQDNGTTLLVSTMVAPEVITFYRVRCESNTSPICLSAMVQTKIWVNPNPEVPVVSDITVCGNAPIQLTVTCSPLQGFGSTTPQWFESDGVTPNNSGVGIPGASPSVYKVQCENTNGNYISGSLTCKSPQASLTLTQKTIPNTPTNITPSQYICLGSNITLAATCAGGSTVKWYDNYNGTPLSNLTVSPVTETPYYVRCETGGIPNCQSTADVSTIFVNSTTPNPPGVSASPTSVTAGETTVLTASNCNGVVKWSYQNATTNPITIAPDHTSNYTATCTENACTSTASTAISITVICPTTYSFSSTGNDISAGNITKQTSNTTGTITTTNKITGTAKVTYQAGKSITLNQGFKVDSGAVFKAEMGGCY